MKTIKDYSEVELKALAYEQITTIENAQNNLKTIHAELTERTKFASEVTGTPDVGVASKGKK